MVTRQTAESGLLALGEPTAADAGRAVAVAAQTIRAMSGLGG